jgi:LuxR family transcriptional regulator, maltose regulon positive regulatory protein
MAHVARGKVLESRGALDEAESALTSAVELSQRGVAKAEMGYALLSLAQLRQSRGQRDEARELVVRARGVIDSCSDPGVLTSLLVKAERSLRSGAARRKVGCEELTDRELGVLRLLATDLSLREIGSALFVSLNTVKTHSRGIYRKLDASSREAAVERARELGLI